MQKHLFTSVALLLGGLQVLLAQQATQTNFKARLDARGNFKTSGPDCQCEGSLSVHYAFGDVLFGDPMVEGIIGEDFTFTKCSYKGKTYPVSSLPFDVQSKLKISYATANIVFYDASSRLGSKTLELHSADMPASVNWSYLSGVNPEALKNTIRNRTLRLQLGEITQVASSTSAFCDYLKNIEYQKEQELKEKERAKQEQQQKEKAEADKVEQERALKEKIEKEKADQQQKQDSMVKPSAKEHSSEDNSTTNSYESAEENYQRRQAEKIAAEQKAKHEADERAINRWKEVNNFYYDMQAKQKTWEAEARQKMDLANQAWINGQQFREAWQQAQKLDISSNDPSRILADFKSKMAEINRMNQEQQREIYNAYQKMSSRSTGNSTNDAATGLAAGIAALASSIDAANEASAARERLRVQKEYAFNKIKTEILVVNNSNAQRFAEAKAKALTEQADEYYGDMASYFNCYTQSISSRFSTQSDSWIQNPCTQPTANGDIDYEPSYSEMVRLARKKIDESRVSPYKFQLLQGANSLLDGAISKNKSTPEAFYYKSLIAENEAEGYLSAYTANQLSGGQEPYLQNLKTKQIDFNNRFYSAIDNEDLAFLSNSIALGLDKVAFKPTEVPPIPYSIVKDKPESLNLLLGASDILSKPEEIYILLLNAVTRNSSKTSLLLFEKTREYISTIENGENLLVLAAKSNAIEAGKVLLIAKASEPTTSEIKKNNGATVTKLAQIYANAAYEADNGKFVDKAFRLNPNFYQSGLTSEDNYILQSVINNKAEYLNAIVGKKIGLDRLGYSLLYTNDLNITTILLKAGFSPDVQDSNGETPLHLAILNNNMPLANGLLSRANPNIKNKAEFTPLHVACQQKNKEAVALLLSKSETNVNIKGPFGWTALHFAAREQDNNTLELLVNRNADKHIADKWNRRAYNVANERRFKNIKRLLR